MIQSFNVVRIDLRKNGPDRRTPDVLLARLLNAEDLAFIESVGGYRARLQRIRLYLQFANRERNGLLRLLVLYSKVPAAVLKLGGATRLPRKLWLRFTGPAPPTCSTGRWIIRSDRT